MLSFKVTAQQKALVEESARVAGSKSPSEWCREVVLNVAKGKQTQVRTDQLGWVRAMMDRQTALILELHRLLHMHLKPFASPAARADAKGQAEAAVDAMLVELFGPEDGEAR